MKMSHDIYRKVYGRYKSERMERRHVYGVTYRQQRRKRQESKRRTQC